MLLNALAKVIRTSSPNSRLYCTSTVRDNSSGVITADVRVDHCRSR